MVLSCLKIFLYKKNSIWLLIIDLINNILYNDIEVSYENIKENYGSIYVSFNAI